MATNYHAEHVGSLLRPPELLEARATHARGEVTDERLRELEDQAALAAIEIQRQAGLRVFTDGEVRRATWMAGLMESIGGLVQVPLPLAKWKRDGGEPPAEETAFEWMAASEKVFLTSARTAVEAGFLAQHAPSQFKITMVSSSMAPLLFNPDVTTAAYETPAELVRGVVDLQLEEIAGLLDQGVAWIQLDSLGYGQVIDDDIRKGLGQAGLTHDGILDSTVSVDAEVARAIKRTNPDVTVALHLCRGNNRSAWAAQGSYEPVAERLFGEVDVDRFLLEYDTERAGGFEPLRFVPRGKTVVLGLVSSKVPQLESQDELRRRIDEAATYVPIENLAISPQCGFASTARGNLLTVDDERRKLELVVDTAQKVWG